MPSSPEPVTSTQTPAEQPETPSAGLRASLSAVRAGERDARALAEVALDAMPESERTPPPPREEPAKKGKAAPEPAEKPVPDKTPTPPEQPKKEEKATTGTVADDGDRGKTKTETTAEETPGKEKRGRALREELGKPKIEQAETSSETAGEETLGVLPTDSERVRKRIKAYDAKLTAAEEARKKAEAEAARLRDEFEQANKKLSTLPSNLDQELKHLRALRRRHEAENDPEVAKVATQIAQSEKLVDDTLNASKVVGNVLKERIRNAGGLAAFARSSETVPLRGADGKTEDVPAAEIYNRIMAVLPGPDADTIRAEIAAQTRLRRSKEETLKAAQAEADTYFAEQEKTRLADEAKRAEAQATIKKGIDQFYAEQTAKDWLRDVEIPANASAEERSEALATNKRRANARNLLRLSIDNPVLVSALGAARGVEDLDELGVMITDSVRLYEVQAERDSLKAKVEKLEAQLKNIRANANRTTSGPGTAKASPSPDGSVPEQEPGESNLAYALRLGRLRSGNA